MYLRNTRLTVANESKYIIIALLENCFGKKGINLKCFYQLKPNNNDLILTIKQRKE